MSSSLREGAPRSGGGESGKNKNILHSFLVCRMFFVSDQKTLLIPSPVFTNEPRLSSRICISLFLASIDVQAQWGVIRACGAVSRGFAGSAGSFARTSAPNPDSLPDTSASATSGDLPIRSFIRSFFRRSSRACHLSTGRAHSVFSFILLGYNWRIRSRQGRSRSLFGACDYSFYPACNSLFLLFFDFDVF